MDTRVGKLAAKKSMTVPLFLGPVTSTRFVRRSGQDSILATARMGTSVTVSLVKNGTFAVKGPILVGPTRNARRQGQGRLFVNVTLAIVMTTGMGHVVRR